MSTASDEHQEGGEEVASAALPIRHDLPCIKCKYNLRGLRDGDCCPECGEAIGHTLDEIEATVLCPGCMAPNHSAAANCRVCGNAIKDAGATANYFRGGSGPGTTATRTRLTSVVLIYLFVAPTLLGCIAYVLYSLIAMFSRGSNFEIFDFFMFMISTVGAIVLLTILIAVTRAYFKRSKNGRDDEEEISPDDQTEPDDN